MPVHTEGADNAWETNVEDHPPRRNSQFYRKSKALLSTICMEAGVNFYGDGSTQDHHSGALWVYDTDTWHMLRNLAGVEWSAQFCADPTKIEVLRQNAVVLYKRFPETLDKFDELGHTEQRTILGTAITDANGVALWTDSIFNASMPLPQPVHTGTIKPSEDGSKLIAGIHYYPEPVWGIQFIKHDNFTLWVTDSEQNRVAVVPLSPKGSGDARVQVIHAQPGSKLHAEMMAHHAKGEAHICEPDHDLSKQAFARQ